MVKVKYHGPRVTRRTIDVVDLGGDCNEDGSSDQLVWDASNDFTVEMPEDMLEVLQGKDSYFSLATDSEEVSDDDVYVETTEDEETEGVGGEA